MTLRKYNLKYTLWEVGWKCSSVAYSIANPAIYIQRPSHILSLLNTTKKVTEHFWEFLIAVNGFLKDRIKKTNMQLKSVHLKVMSQLLQMSTSPLGVLEDFHDNIS